ncbi:ribosome biogenesis protein MRT4 [Vairimorpha necatrix]|uniref:Ribosome biogenesis protein MRT4 n=1 Tax=Vairimorpha necatrix TaxID=6039 RepID=A0AAX4JBZ9_9MICR
MRGKIQKKLKEKKLETVDKFTSLIKDHEYICVVENTDISASLMNKMRTELENTSILFVKKKMLCKKYNFFNKDVLDKNFFLVFTNTSGIENIKKYKFETYYDINDISDEDFIINKGKITNKELADLLPTITEKNITILEDDYVVCKKGEAINEKQLKILKCQKKKMKEKPIRILEVYETKNIK